MINDDITRHFDMIADNYDEYKKKNNYYYEILKKLYLELIPEAKSKRILEIGCGTGNLISFLRPKQGIGIDVSKQMIRIAKEKHRDIDFKVMSAEFLELDGMFDYIFLADVIEHLSNLNLAFRNMNKISDKDSIIIITAANTLWEPILLLAEKLGLKMPEGPHNRPSYKQFAKILDQNNFKVIKRGYRFLIPKRLPIIHNINKVFYKIPLVRCLGMIEYLVIRPKLL